MLKMNNLCKSVKGRQVLKSININVEEGMIYGFIGHNGAGKTTTMRTIVGLTGFDSGEIVFDGKVNTSKVEISQAIGYLPESPSFYGYMTGKEYIAYIGRNLSRKQVKDLLEKVGLKKGMNKKVVTYSRGMKQRLGMAAAMIHNPKLLIMDEPTSALDPAGRFELFEMIKELKNQGSTIILSTHILDDIEKVSDRIGIIKEGQILKEGNVEQVLMDYYRPIFDIQCEKISPELIASIKTLNWVEDVQYEDNLLSLQTHDVEIGKDKILKFLYESEMAISGYQLRKPTLEDVFMKEIRL